MAIVSADLLTIVNKAEDELGLVRSTGVAGSTELQARQMRALLNALGQDLLDAHEWSALTEKATITTVAGQDTYSLPADYRGMIDDSHYDSSRGWRVAGPISPRMDAALRGSALVGVGVDRFRIRGSSVTLWPTPSVSGTLITYEYKTSSWVRSGSTQAAVGQNYVSDTDVTYFRTQVLVAGLKWKFMMAKGFDANPLREDYERLKARAIADDVGGRVISMSHEYGCDGLTAPVIVLPAGQ
jgi:hypothetical protein